MDLARRKATKSYELKNKLLLAKNQYGYTAWHREEAEDSLGALEILWIWAEKAVLNRYKVLLIQNNEGYTARQLAARRRHLNIVVEVDVCEKKRY